MSDQDPLSYPSWNGAERLPWGSLSNANYRERICSDNLIDPSLAQQSPG